jgi:hypothetical protein
MADVIEAIAKNPDAHGKSAPGMVRAVKRLAVLLRRDLTAIQASVQVINIHLNSIVWQPAGFKSAKAFANWRSLVRKAVYESAVSRPLQPLLRLRDYPDAWKQWIATVDDAVREGKATPWARAAVAAVPSWCAARGIPPMEFDDVAARLMAEWWSANGANTGRRKAVYVKKAIIAWNALAAAGIGGGTSVMPPVGRRKRLNIQLDEMPSSLREDIESYVHHIRNRSIVGGVELLKSDSHPARPVGRFDHLRAPALRDVVFEEPATGRRKPLGPASDSTVSNSLHAIRTVVTACVRSGRVALTSTTRLIDCLGHQQLVDALAMLEQRAIARSDSTNADDVPGSFHTVAAQLVAIARWARIDPREIAAMTAVSKSPEVKVESVNAMPAGRRAILNEMDRPEMVLSWFRAPSELWKRAEKARAQGSLTWEAVCYAEAAFIAWLLTRLPLRRKNIGLLTFKGDSPMIRLGRFEGETSILEVPGWLTKNGRSLRFRLTGEGEAMLRRIIGDGRGESYRDAAMRLGQFEDTDHLFVGRSQTRVRKRRFTGHRALSNLGNIYTARMRAFGIPATLHVARHICAQIALDHDPSAVPLVANLLGDSVRTVERHYLADRTSKAAEAFDRIVKASIKKAFTMLSEGEPQ